jgi:hypothetical protein
MECPAKWQLRRSDGSRLAQSADSANPPTGHNMNDIHAKPRHPIKPFSFAIIADPVSM